MDCPCKNCVPPKRTPYCHSTCEYYKKWCEEYKKEKELSKAYIESMDDIIDSYYGRKRKR